MKKAINKKVYNTETGVEVASIQIVNIGNPYGDDRYNESLFITKNGNWFIHGIGTPFSNWGKRYAKHWCEKNGIKYDQAQDPFGEISGSEFKAEDIIAFNDEEAYQWLEENDQIDIIEKYFADLIEEA